METISLKQLIEYPFSIVNNIGIWNFEEIIEEIGLNFYDLNQEKFDASLFEIKKIYNNPGGSDEQSYRNLLFFKDKFCCIYGYTGDKGYSNLRFASEEQHKILKEYFVSLIEGRYNNEVLYLDENIEINSLSDQYTKVIKIDNALYYNVENPQWSGVWGNNNNMYYMNDDNELIKCKFVRFKTNCYRNIFDDESKKMIIEIDGIEVESDYNRIIVKM